VIAEKPGAVVFAPSDFRTPEGFIGDITKSVAILGIGPKVYPEAAFPSATTERFR
jgi:hypothetical protein